ncbi:MAG: 1-phosphofructokinase [Oscillospiraceae bacterium]|nr:1-phosphofructokinase [Oscillospiraceae bacterium]
MIYTLTLNPAMDKTVVIENFTAGSVNRIQSLRVDVGGKGINVSKCLKSLGCSSTAAAFWGGAAGQRGIDFLCENGIGSLAVLAAEDTRTNLKIIDPVRHENTDINEPGPTITEENLAELVGKLDGAITAGDILILSGSIPKGCKSTIYRDLILRYQQKGAKVYLDADGENFRHGITAAPALIKPNIDELNRHLGTELKEISEIAGAARAFLEQGIAEVVVSLGADGALLVKKDVCLKADGLQVPVRSTVGAGDSMVAALAFGAQQGLTDKQRLKLAIAISAASVMCSGTQAPEAEQIEKLYHQVTIREVN